MLKSLTSLKLSLFQLSLIAINTSGSVALELARAGTPMISVYKCGWFFERILKTFVKVKSANLINIILEKMLYQNFYLKNVPHYLLKILRKNFYQMCHYEKNKKIFLRKQ